MLRRDKHFLSGMTLATIALFACASTLAEASEEPYQINVLSLGYFPDENGDGIVDPDIAGTGGSGGGRPVAETQAYVRDLMAQLVWTLETGSTYHGYKDAAARPSLRYTVLEHIEYIEPIPPSAEFPPFADHFQVLNRVNVCDYVRNQGVKEVWIWMYHTDAIAPIESNMSGPYGDISNSWRQDDLPDCGQTYTVYDYNYGRAVSEATENHMHQIEALLNFVDSRSSTPSSEWDSLLFWGKFVGSDASPRVVRPGCGWSHYPPNGESDYDWANPRFVSTDCEDWNPQGTGPKQSFNCERWGCNGHQFFVWWMQNLPGRDNGLTYRGRDIRNWWHFVGDFDAAMAEGKSLLGWPAAVDGPVAYYPLDGDARDAGPFENHGTVQGPRPTADRHGAADSAYGFDGIDDRITIPDDLTLNFNEAMTVAAWVRPASAKHGSIVNKAYNMDAFRLDFTGVEYGFKVTFPDEGWGRNVFVYAPAEIGVWAHVVGIYTGSEIQIFLDGLRVATEDASGRLQQSTRPVVIGNHPDWEAFDGRIDEVRLYNRALSPEEIRSLYVEDQLRVVNQYVSFTPQRGSYRYTANADGCPAGYAGRFSFTSRLRNASAEMLTNLRVRIARLTNDNLLLIARHSGDGTEPTSDWLATGDMFAVTCADGYADGLLGPAEDVYVPFELCLKTRTSFRFNVDVLGLVGDTYVPLAAAAAGECR